MNHHNTISSHRPTNNRNTMKKSKSFGSPVPRGTEMRNKHASRGPRGGSARGKSMRSPPPRNVVRRHSDPHHQKKPPRPVHKIKGGRPPLVRSRTFNYPNCKNGGSMQKQRPIA